MHVKTSSAAVEADRQLLLLTAEQRRDDVQESRREPQGGEQLCRGTVRDGGGRVPFNAVLDVRLVFLVGRRRHSPSELHSERKWSVSPDAFHWRDLFFVFACLQIIVPRVKNR